MDLTAYADRVVPDDARGATLVARVFDPGCGGPCVAAVRGDGVIDLTDIEPTTADLLERPDAVEVVRSADATGRRSWPLGDLLRATLTGDRTAPRLLAPVDLQVLKAAGVTFVRSMVERVIEERAAGDPHRAEEVRAMLEKAVGGAISQVRPGTPEVAQVKEVLQREGLWSQYLEVGIGPDPEIFTRPCLSAVGTGGDRRPVPLVLNNPSRAVLAVNSAGTPVAATLGNDVTCVTSKVAARCC